MPNEIDRIVLSSELRNEVIADSQKAYTDVIVRLKNGTQFAASFFAYKSIELLYQKHQQNGDYSYGDYFWIKGMVLIKDCKRESIEKVVRFMLDEGDFKKAFTKLE